MTLTPSTMLPLGTPAPDFVLPDPRGDVVSLSRFADAEALDRRGLRPSLTSFSSIAALHRAIAIRPSSGSSGHCPFVKHLTSHHGTASATKPVRGWPSSISRPRAGATDYRRHRVAVVGINSNDAAAFPEDSPERMVEDVATFDYPFPYLADGTQAVAKAYRAACTPDFHLFDGDRLLVYLGQFDGSRPKNDIPVTGVDLRAAVDAVLAGQPVGEPQTPSIGCNIKWKPDNAPEYFSG